MKKKILYFGGFNLPDKNAAAQRVVANSKIFKELGFEVVLVGLSSEKDNVYSPFVYESMNCINLKHPRGILEWFKYLFTIYDYEKIIESEKPDIVIAYNHPAYSLKRLYIYNKTRQIKTLADCTEWYNAGGGGFIFKLIKNRDVNYRMNKVQPRLDGIIVISKFLESFYNDKSIKTLLLPPLVDKYERKWEGSDITNNDSLRLVYAGSTSRQKDRLDVIINLLNKVATEENINITFNVLGLTSEQYHKMFLLNETIPSFVTFRGRVSHLEAITELKKSDFQIFFRDDNLINTAGFPTKFVESISSRCLVLTNKSSNLDDYLVDGVNGFWIDKTNERTMYSSLVRALKTSRNTINEMRAKMDANIFDYRNFENITELFIEQIYKG